MPGTTPTLALRYQLPGDPPDGDDLGLNLATDVENAILADRVGVMCQLVQQTTQTGWATNTPTAITFGSGSEIVDTGTFHDTGSNTSRIVIGKKLGWWKVSGVYCPLSSSTTTAARCYLAKNGTAVSGTLAGPYMAGAGVIGIAIPPFLNSAPAVCSLTAVWHCPS
jgi:hypothetical protein